MFVTSMMITKWAGVFYLSIYTSNILKLSRYEVHLRVNPKKQSRRRSKDENSEKNIKMKIVIRNSENSISRHAHDLKVIQSEVKKHTR